MRPGHPGLGWWFTRVAVLGEAIQPPVNVFRTPTGVRIALTYGADSQWVKNVVAAQGCTLRTQGHTLTLSEPRIVHDPERTSIRPLERRVLGMLAVDDFLDLTEYHESAG